jgi:hypothetical protein
MWDLFAWIKDIFRTPSAIELACKELDEAEKQHLSLNNTREYVAGMLSYREAQISRLRTYITNHRSKDVLL